MNPLQVATKAAGTVVLWLWTFISLTVAATVASANDDQPMLLVVLTIATAIVLGSLHMLWKAFRAHIMSRGGDVDGVDASPVRYRRYALVLVAVNVVVLPMVLAVFRIGV